MALNFPLLMAVAIILSITAALPFQIANSAMLKILVVEGDPFLMVCRKKNHNNKKFQVKGCPKWTAFFCLNCDLKIFVPLPTKTL